MRECPDITNTTAEIVNRPDPLILFRAPGAIEAQEARGQREMVTGQSLPSKVEDREVFEALGFTFGEPYKDDPLFAPATLPEGWKKVPTDHDMWSNIVDTKGRRRAQVFYKAAFYDRKARMRLASRYVFSADYGDGDGSVVSYVKDGSDVVYRTAMFTSAEKREVWDAADAQKAEVEAWMDANRPGWRDPIKQWEDGPSG